MNEHRRLSRKCARKANAKDYGDITSERVFSGLVGTQLWMSRTAENQYVVRHIRRYLKDITHKSDLKTIMGYANDNGF